MPKLERLQRLVRSKGNFQTMEEGLKLFRNILELLKNWLDPSDLLVIFRPKEIDGLLVDALKLYYLLWDRQIGEKRVVYDIREPALTYFIGYVIQSGYKGEPELDGDGRPVTRRSTALHQALRCDRRFFRCLIISEIIPELFEVYHRHDVNYADEGGLTHLHVACRFGRVKLVEDFLEAGADPNCRASSTGQTALHFALQTDVLADRRAVINLLLKRGANPNLADAEGRSALHVICHEFGDDWFIAKMVLGLCGDKYRPMQVNARDSNGDTPLDLARKAGHEDLVRLLRKYDDGSKSTDAPEETITCKIARISLD